MNNRLRSLFSLCQKAGFLVTGEESCQKSLQHGTAKLVIISEDASDNTKKKFVNKAFFYNIESIVFGGREEINQCIGKANRTTFIITEENFATNIKALIKLEVEAETET